jgi:uncharacterized protein YdaT
MPVCPLRRGRNIRHGILSRGIGVKDRGKKIMGRRRALEWERGAREYEKDSLKNKNKAQKLTATMSSLTIHQT